MRLKASEHKSELTLKQTQSEKGSVTKTRAQEMAVSSQPQRPIPLSDSSAEKSNERYEMTALCAFLQQLKMIL